MAGVMEYCLAQIYNHPTFFPADQPPPGMTLLLPNTEKMHEYDSNQHIFVADFLSYSLNKPTPHIRLRTPTELFCVSYWHPERSLRYYDAPDNAMGILLEGRSEHLDITFDRLALTPLNVNRYVDTLPYPEYDFFDNEVENHALITMQSLLSSFPRDLRNVADIKEWLLNLSS